MNNGNFTRRKFLELAGLGLAAGPGLFLMGKDAMAGPLKPLPEKPNVLFIFIDDLNDWVGYLKGHPQAYTPNIDKLARQSFVFSNAHCASPTCNPSRVATISGVINAKVGIYDNKKHYRDSPALKDSLTLFENFRSSGYKTYGVGKISHFKMPELWDEFGGVRWDDIKSLKAERPFNGIHDAAGNFDWGPIDREQEEMVDWQHTDWAVQKLQEKHDQPFLLACGLIKPHLPWFVPKKYFDRYPLEDLSLPIVNKNDQDDLPEVTSYFITNSGDHEKVISHNQWRAAVQGYLASVSLADECAGRLLKALENSAYADNTVVVLVSDQGYHLGEKLHWRKFSLWEEATRIPFLIKMPGMKGSVETSAPVNQVDLYPTLSELCGLQKPTQELDGHSLVPLMKDPGMEWSWPSLTTYLYKNHGLRSRDWRYIQYYDGSEELYNKIEDPLEWDNLAEDRGYENILRLFREQLPEINVEPIPEMEKAG